MMAQPPVGDHRCEDDHHGSNDILPARRPVDTRPQVVAIAHRASSYGRIRGARRTYVRSRSWRTMKAATSARESTGKKERAAMSSPSRKRPVASPFESLGARTIVQSQWLARINA